MEIVRRVHSMKEISRQLRARDRKIGFVPTMGSLHEGHLSLVNGVRKLADEVVVSIFVNPTQFGADEDFDTYPRDLSRDADLLIAEEVDYLFAPDGAEIYPPGPPTFVEVTELSPRLEGASRPDHFRGVTTVVLKLLEVVKPTVAAFGQKDAQQAVIIKRMARDLMLDPEILIMPIVRDEDGVALSSRNAYLSPDERRAARAIFTGLAAAAGSVEDGSRDPDKVTAAAREVVEQEELLRIDYIELVDADTLRPVVDVRGEMLLLAAVYSGATRLIDNIVIRV